MTADLGMIAPAAYPSPPNYSSFPRQKPSVSSLYDRAAMASSLSPNPLSQSNLGGNGTSGQEKGPLSTLNLNFLKTLTEKRTTRGVLLRIITPSQRPCNVRLTPNADGQPPKRRGPKPDSKPALTRRQELNRQAQR